MKRNKLGIALGLAGILGCGSTGNVFIDGDVKYVTTGSGELSEVFDKGEKVYHGYRYELDVVDIAFCVCPILVWPIEIPKALMETHLRKGVQPYTEAVQWEKNYEIFRKGK